MVLVLVAFLVFVVVLVVLVDAFELVCYSFFFLCLQCVQWFMLLFLLAIEGKIQDSTCLPVGRDLTPLFPNLRGRANLSISGTVAFISRIA